jgi:hypothetical protein
MADITITPAGLPFGGTDTVTSTRLNEARNPTAALVAASIGTADIADDAITPALIAGDAVTTPAILDANVTFAKLTDVIDDDTMATATDTTLATSESIKAYVDTSKTSAFTPSTYAGEESVTLPNGLIMKMGSTINKTFSYGTAFPTNVVSVTISNRSSYGDTYGNASFVTSSSASGFTISSGISVSGNGPWFWQAIGY